MMLLLSMAIICFYLYYYIFIRNYNYWKVKGIKYEKPFLIFGNFYDAVKRKKTFSKILDEIYNKHQSEPYVGIYMFNQPALLIRNPELIRKILIKDFDKFINRKVAANEKVDPIAFHTLFTSQDKTWKNLRSKVTPVYTAGKMKLMFPLMVGCTKDLTEFLEQRNGEIIEFSYLMKRFAADLIFSCGFGINSNCVKNEQTDILKVVKKLNDSESVLRNFSIFSFMFVPQLVQIFRLTFLDQASSDYLINVFKETMKEREQKNVIRNDLMHFLNGLKNSEDINNDYIFDDTIVACQAVALFAAGNDTTATALTYGFYELALNQSIQIRLREEIMKVTEEHGDLTYTAIQDMKYLNMVFSEILRKYSIATFLNRNTKMKYTFEETGFTLEKNDSVIISITALHSNPEYFPNPEVFDPERFSDENKQNIKPFTYLPFGDGPRNCIGQRFAILVIKTALAWCIKNFLFEKVPATPVPMEMKKLSVFQFNEKPVFLKVSKL